MKYKVIGWTSFENNDIPEGVPTIATDNAIVDGIKANGYCFTGCEHQNQPTGTPVLNDGKKYTYGERAWGQMMAQAHDDDDYVVYCLCRFFWRNKRSYAT